MATKHRSYCARCLQKNSPFLKLLIYLYCERSIVKGWILKFGFGFVTLWYLHHLIFDICKLSPRVCQNIGCNGSCNVFRRGYSSHKWIWHNSGNWSQSHPMKSLKTSVTLPKAWSISFRATTEFSFPNSKNVNRKQTS